ncbi:vascular endothelial growth factor receptor kdr-like [Sitodiplosis mosellana]|uniref:vascular endothelial growth factor receptor kdr-like n=1 Tax=Sitodiplosis mosellana TaxID=263140 RepID=UPI002443A2AC|nr:vascular endothelial growth factor receptor kdr-like [Sitodiplosis mosellana]
MTPSDLAKLKGHVNVTTFLDKHIAKIYAKHNGNENNRLVYTIVGVVILIGAFTILPTYLYVQKRRKSQLIRKPNATELEYFEQGNAEGINSNLTLDEQADLLPYDRKYEFPREKLKLRTQLGNGAFGVVYEGIAHGILAYEEKTKVAVKMVKRTSNDEIMRALVLELKIMVHLGQHLNLVNLLGAVTKNITKYNMMLIVEYCRYGNLQNILIKKRSSFIDQINRDTDTINSNIYARKQKYVRSELEDSDSHEVDHQSVYNSLYARDFNDGDRQSVINSLYDQVLNNMDHGTDDASDDAGTSTSNNSIDSNVVINQITTTDLLCWSFQITRGMHYLASCKVLHGDLAARNILLCDNNVIKICDFGLARSLYKTDIYRKNKEALLPFKWLALESIEDHIFSIHTDVWAFGIVLWELFSLGMTPYPGLDSGLDLYQKLLDGYRMEKPNYATQDVYDIMLSCWRVKPESRPLFDELEENISKLLETSVAKHYINLNEPYLKANVEKYNCGTTDYAALIGTPNFQAPSPPSATSIPMVECNKLSIITSDTSPDIQE